MFNGYVLTGELHVHEPSAKWGVFFTAILCSVSSPFTGGYSTDKQSTLCSLLVSALFEFRRLWRKYLKDLDLQAFGILFTKLITDKMLFHVRESILYEP